MLSAIITNLNEELIEERDNFEDVLQWLNEEKLKVVEITAKNI